VRTEQITTVLRCCPMTTACWFIIPPASVMHASVITKNCHYQSLTVAVVFRQTTNSCHVPPTSTVLLHSQHCSRSVKKYSDFSQTRYFHICAVSAHILIKSSLKWRNLHSAPFAYTSSEYAPLPCVCVRSSRSPAYGVPDLFAWYTCIRAIKFALRPSISVVHTTYTVL